MNKRRRTWLPFRRRAGAGRRATKHERRASPTPRRRGEPMQWSAPERTPCSGLQSVSARRGQEAGGEWALGALAVLCVGVKRSPLGLHHRSYCASLYPLESMPKSTAARRRLLLEFSYTFPPCLQLRCSSFHPPSSNNSAQSLVLAPRVQCAHLLLFSPPTPSRSAVQASSTVSFARTTSTRPHHQCSCLPAREPGFFRVTACLQPHRQGSQN